MNLRPPFDPDPRTPVVRFVLLLVAAAALATAGVAQVGLQGSHDAAVACLQRFSAEELLSHGERIARSCATEQPRATRGPDDLDWYIEQAALDWAVEQAAARAANSAPTRFTTELDRLRAAGHAAQLRQNAAAADRETASQ